MENTWFESNSNEKEFNIGSQCTYYSPPNSPDYDEVRFSVSHPVFICRSIFVLSCPLLRPFSTSSLHLWDPYPSLCRILSWLCFPFLLALIVFHLTWELFRFLNCYANSLSQGLAIPDIHIPWIQINFFHATNFLQTLVEWIWNNIRLLLRIKDNWPYLWKCT